MNFVIRRRRQCLCGNLLRLVMAVILVVAGLILLWGYRKLHNKNSSVTTREFVAKTTTTKSHSPLPAGAATAAVTTSVARERASHDPPPTLHNNNDDTTTTTTTTVHHIQPLPFCQRNDILQGSWVPVQLAQGAPYIASDGVHARCPHQTPAWYAARPFATYDWKVQRQQQQDDDSSSSSSSSCRFTPFEPNLFCNVLNQTTLLLAGDSLTFEQFLALLDALGERNGVNFRAQFWSKRGRRPVMRSVCQGTVQLAYQRSDDLEWLGEIFNKNKNSTTTAESASSSHFFPQVLVLNRGAHYTADHRLRQGIRRSFGNVQAWLDQCHAWGIKCHFLWRTCVPGHAECEKFTQPNNDLQAMEDYIANYNYGQMNHSKRHLFHWFDFKHQNELVLNELQQQSFYRQHQNETLSTPTTRIIDAYHIGIRRPDQHRPPLDCLHSCYPGTAVDVYNRLVLHYLRMDRTTEDNNRLHQVRSQKGWWVNQTEL